MAALPPARREELAAALKEAEAQPQIAADPSAIIETRQWTREADALAPLIASWLAEARAEGAAEALAYASRLLLSPEVMRPFAFDPTTEDAVMVDEPWSPDPHEDPAGAGGVVRDWSGVPIMEPEEEP